MARPRTEAAEFRKMMFRLPVPVHEACQQHAKREHRSLNAQMLCMLEQWLAKHPYHGDGTPDRSRSVPA